MPEEGLTPSFFQLNCFAEFYEEVANIKLAIAEGRLGAYLAVGDEVPPTQAVDLASRVSGKLTSFLRQQAQTVSKNSSEATHRAYGVTQYIMAALADEIFILEIDWTGRKVWLDVLMEYKLFRTRDAGKQFFQLAERLLNAHQRSPQHIDLAAVLLLALQLGFKGFYRGEEGEATLEVLREKLHRLVNTDRPKRDTAAFPEAYQQLVVGKNEERIAPLRPWYWAGAIALGVYLVVSTSVWFALLRPFNTEVGHSVIAVKKTATSVEQSGEQAGN